MKKITLLLFLLVASFSVKAQTTLFEDSFESYTDFAITGVGSWTLTDLDLTNSYTIGAAGAFTYANAGGLKAFQVWNPSAVVPATLATPTAANDFTSKTGSKCMVCFNAVPTSTVLNNNDWLISPQVVLGTTNTVSFWAKACDATYNAEKFSVWISSTNTTAPASFVKISAGASIVTAGITWVQYTYAIPASYNNLSVYIGINCVSDDQYVFAVDDFKVKGTVACPLPTAGTSVVNTGFLYADLSWTAGGAANSQIVYQLQGAGAPSNAPATGTSVSGTTYTTGALLENTSYEFYVRDVCTAGTSVSNWAGPFLFNTLTAPACVTLVAPATAATAVPYSPSVNLTWTAASTGGTPTSYDVYVGTIANPTALTGNVTTLNYNFTTGAGTTTYYWKVIAKNSVGSAVGCSTVFSFTTGASPFGAYCGPVTFTNDLEPITLVNFAGINKSYPNTIVAAATAVHHKIFTDVATIAQGSTNSISLNGNSGGSFTNYYTVFIDWNQNNILSDAGEVYFGTTPLTLANTTGLPATTPVVGSIVVPATATLGNTRMRIKKVFGTSTTVPPGMINPCISTTNAGQYGEVHDYIVNVTPLLATDNFTSLNFKSYPNPVKDILSITYDKNITNISVINLLGQEVLSNKNDSQDVKVDMSGLASGVYTVKISADNEVKTIKVIKE